MGFKGFRIKVPDNVAYRQAGNSIAVPVIKQVMKSIFKAVPSLKKLARKSKVRNPKGK